MKNKKLENLFNMCDDNENEKYIDKETFKSNKLITDDKFNALLNENEKNNNLFFLKDEESEKKLNEMRDLALIHYKEMIELGYNTDPKYSSNFLESAVSLMNSAILAEKIKIEKRLEDRKIAIQEKKLKLLQKKIELEKQKLNRSGIEMIENEEGIFVDRNELLRKLLDKK